MESIIAVGSVVTVVGAVVTILIRVMLGDSQKRRIEKIRAELLAESSAQAKPSAPSSQEQQA